METFTRWRKYYLTNGCFRPDRRGRFTTGFLLRHEDLKLALTQWIMGRTKRDINISDVRSGTMHINTRMHTRTNTITLTHLRRVISSTIRCYKSFQSEKLTSAQVFVVQFLTKLRISGC